MTCGADLAPAISLDEIANPLFTARIRRYGRVAPIQARRLPNSLRAASRPIIKVSDE